MSSRRSSVGVAVLNGRLYAVGGYDGVARQCLNSVEKYDPGTTYMGSNAMLIDCEWHCTSIDWLCF